MIEHSWGTPMESPIKGILGQFPSLGRVLWERLRGSGVPMEKVGVHFHDTYGQAVSGWARFKWLIRRE